MTEFSFDRILTPEEKKEIAVKVMADWIERERRALAIALRDGGHEVGPELQRYLPEEE